MTYAPAGWNSVETIPKDRPVEVIAEPHPPQVVKWNVNRFADGRPVYGPPTYSWHQWPEPRGGLMVPIAPTAWREIEK